MKFIQTDNGIIMTNFTHFHIAQILECGQCFRFEKLDEGFYFLVAFGKVLYVRQDSEAVLFWYESGVLEPEEFKSVWIPYFDLDRDYGAISARFAENDPVMSDAIAFAPGIRVLNQEPWEMVISFIISQNNRIPQIKKVIKNISERYGTKIDDTNYAFPTVEQLLAARPEDLRECKTGFRDKYILDASHKAANKELHLGRDIDATTEGLRQSLLSVKGIGEKVAHCILLFGYGRFDTFPVDTWVRKVMEEYYFGGNKASVADIHKFAYERFGALSGIAQQYLFHYIRLKT